MLHDYVWGGRKLAKRYGKGDGTRIAESWETCDAMDELRLQLKWIDTDFPTSVQVHPRPSMPGQSGAEVWVIVDSEPESRIGIGFRHGITRDELLDAFQTRTFDLHINTLHPKPGDCLVVPAGTIHYIDGGVTVLELKSSASPTLRLHDWGREATTNRAVHITEGLDAMIYDATAPIRYDLCSEYEPISVSLDTLHLKLLWRESEKPVFYDGSPRLMTQLDGMSSIDDGVTLQKGETVWIPPETNFLPESIGGITLEVFIQYTPVG